MSTYSLRATVAWLGLIFALAAAHSAAEAATMPVTPPADLQTVDAGGDDQPLVRSQVKDVKPIQAPTQPGDVAVPKAMPKAR